MVDRSASVPLYKQVANQLRKEIIYNRYGERGRIGTHTELAERFSVSLITIRKAIEVLEQDGIVDVQQGKGTFVRYSGLVDPLKNLTGISFLTDQLSVQTEVSVPVLELIRTPEWLPRDVRSVFGRNSLHVVRISSIQGTPVANTDMYLPAKFAGMFAKEEVERQTVYQIFQNKLGVKLGKGWQVIRAAGASGIVAQNLRIPENWPVLQIERKAYDADSNLIEYMILTYEASRYAFVVEMELSTGSGAIVNEQHL